LALVTESEEAAETRRLPKLRWRRTSTISLIAPRVNASARVEAPTRIELVYEALQASA
jgi:hypothetical protein